MAVSTHFRCDSADYSEKARHAGTSLSGRAPLYGEYFAHHTYFGALVAYFHGDRPPAEQLHISRRSGAPAVRINLPCQLVAFSTAVG